MIKGAKETDTGRPRGADGLAACVETMRHIKLERYLGTRFKENFYAFINKLVISSRGIKSKEFAGKGNELMTSEAMLH